MATRMDGILQPSLFSMGAFKMDVIVNSGNRYRILAEKLPWKELGAVANQYRMLKVQIHIGRPLDLRAHLGAFIAQSMNRWTDRETEDMVAHHAGVRVLCSLEFSNATIDHTSIETFRNQLTDAGVEAINKIVVMTASASGFTGSALCSSDTTVQESPIAHPTEVGHMRNIADKLVGIGKKIHKKISQKLEALSDSVQKTFTEIRLFTRGKKEDAIKRKKILSKKLQQIVARMQRLVESEVSGMNAVARAKYQESLDFYRLMLKQIRHWMD